MAKTKGMKAKLELGVKGDPSTNMELTKGKVQFISGRDAEKPELEESVAPAWVRNSLDHNMTLSYGGDAMVVPPRGKVKIPNMQKMGGLPKGLVMIPIVKT